MELDRLRTLETIDPTPQPPWQTPAFAEIDIEPDREKAKDKALARLKGAGIAIFSDASGQRNELGAEAVLLDQNHQILQARQISIGSMAHWSVYAAELMAIYYAIGLAFLTAMKNRDTPATGIQPVTNINDSMSALQANSKYAKPVWPTDYPGHHPISERTKDAWDSPRLQWVPGHCGDPGNEAADRG
jgi:ribonuclease HI